MLAYARQQGSDTVIVLAGRLFSQLPAPPGELPVQHACWGDTSVDVSAIAALADGAGLRDALTGHAVAVQGGRLQLADVFANLPLAALVVEV